MMAQAVGSGMDIMMDAARVKNENLMMDKLARTLELLYGYEVDNQPHPFKGMLKMTVRRAVTNGVAYIKLGYERVMQIAPRPGEGHRRRQRAARHLAAPRRRRRRQHHRGRRQGGRADPS
jgi:hypothetical protein